MWPASAAGAVMARGVPASLQWTGLGFLLCYKPHAPRRLPRDAGSGQQIGMFFPNKRFSLVASSTALAVVAAGVTAAVSLGVVAFRPTSEPPAERPTPVTPAAGSSAPVTAGQTDASGAAVSRAVGESSASSVALLKSPVSAGESTAAALAQWTFGSRFHDPAIGADQPKLAAFAGWTQRYLAAPDARAKAALVSEGVALAQARREDFASLIRWNPAGALAATVPMAVRDQLPASVARQLEERVSGRGDLHVYGTTPAPGEAAPAEPTFRTVTVAGRAFRAYVFGRREGQSSKRDISLAGVAIDDALALSASPVRVLEAGEAPGLGKGIARLCPVSGFSVPDTDAASTAGTAMDTPTVEVGGALLRLCHVEHVSELERRLVRAETRAGPYAGALAPEAFSPGSTGEQAAAGTGTEGAFYPAEWTTGQKRVLFMLVDFPDLTGAPIVSGGPVNTSVVLNAFYGFSGCAEFFNRCSYGQTSLAIGAGDVTGVLRLPKKAGLYASSGDVDALFADALAAARRAGFDTDSYDRQVVLFSNIANLTNSRFHFGGLGEVGGKQLMLNGTLSPLTHELGHTYGLRHANLWQTTDRTVTGAGSSVEYGDPSDVMGRGYDGFGYPNLAEFNMWSRNLLGWLPDSSVQTVVTSGTYRVYHFDNSPPDRNRTLALKIPGDVRGDSERDYWIGIRQKPAATFNSSIQNLYVIWGYHDVRPSDLLDMVPTGTPGYANDAGLTVGRAFSENGVSITPVAVTGSPAPNDQLDVQIILGSSIKLGAAEVQADPETGRATVTLNRTGSTSGQTRMRYQTIDGSARAGVDYIPVAGEVVWADGETAARTITILLATNAALPSPSTFSVQISAVPYGNGGMLGASTATVRIPGVGSLDRGFAVSGAILPSPAAITRPDGSMIVGNRLGNSFTSEFQLARLDAQGNASAGFPAAGNARVQGGLRLLTAQPDGKLLAATGLQVANTLTGSYPQVSRWNADGTLDPGFVFPRGLFEEIYALAVQPDGKILVGGSVLVTTSGSSSFSSLVRLNPDGSLDPDFRLPPGFNAPTRSVSVRIITLQQDGRILIFGGLPQGNTNSPGLHPALSRLNADGSLDLEFNNAMLAAWPPVSNGAVPFNPNVSAIVVQPDGRILIGGSLVSLDSSYGPALARFLADGSRDPSLRPGITLASGYAQSVSAFLVQPDGRIVIGGNFDRVSGLVRRNLARLHADGSLDPTFDCDLAATVPVETVSLGVPPLSVRLISARPDGSLIVFYTQTGEIGPLLSQPVHSVRLLSGRLRPGVVQLETAGRIATPGEPLTLTVRRVGGSDGEIAVNYATQNGSASDVADEFTAQSGVLRWAAGDDSLRTITLAAGASGAGKDFAFNLAIPVGGVLLGDMASTRIFIGGMSGALTITSPGSATGTARQAFDFAVTANGPARAFDATGLPAGLMMDHTTGRIVGAPTNAGTFQIDLTATGPLGDGNAALALTILPPATAAFFNGEAALANGVYYLSFPNGNFFGYYAYLTDPRFIFHFDLGYEYWFEANDGNSGVFFYDFKSSSFFYTSPVFPFPYLYDFSLNAVLYYFPDPNNPGRYNTNGTRFFYNYATGQVITK